MQTIKVGPYIFECSNDIEAWRAQGLLIKEEGTIRWIEASVQPGDVVYDIGANIGLYTIVAGAKVGDAGCVYAFEPHVGSAGRLLRNVRVNKLAPRVRVLSVALSDREGFLPFNYTSNEPGSSGSQLGHAFTEGGVPFDPVATEIKYATTVDTLIRELVIPPANVVKLDVDGNELAILTGMRGLLTRSGLRTVQVEIHPASDAAILAHMAEAGFTLLERHYTVSGKKAIAQGAAPEAVFHNAVFTRL